MQQNFQIVHFIGKISIGLIIRVIYKEIWLTIMMIEHTIFARSNSILS